MQQQHKGGKPSKKGQPQPSQQQHPQQPQPPQQPRPPQPHQQSVPVPGKGGASGTGGKPAADYVVFTKANDANEVVVRTLIGEYMLKGDNHGRRVCQKISDKSSREHVDVYLYYWDGRDGAAFEGWWFGNQLGGTQVWAHCKDSGLLPPSTGWRIPWDAPVRPTLVIMPKAEQQRQEAAAKVKAIEADLGAMEGPAKLAVEQARALASDFTEVEPLKSAEELLAPHVEAVTKLQNKLPHQGAVPADRSRAFAQLTNQVRGLTSAVTGLSKKVTDAREQLEQEERDRELEEKDIAIYSQMIPDAMTKTNNAEDSAEKAIITFEMIALSGDNMGEAKLAMEQTEVATREAQTTISEARFYINQKMATAKRLQSAKYRNEATEELSKMLAQCQEAQNKLNPLKTVRQDFMNRQAAQQVIHAMLDKLTPAEVDVDRAEEATLLLAGDSLTKDMVREAESATARATANISSAQRFIEQKKAAAGAAFSEDIERMDERIKNSQERLAQLKASQKEAHENIEAKHMVEMTAEATEQVNSVNADVDRVVPVAEALVKSRGADEENALQATDAAKEDIDATLQKITKALGDINGHLDSMKTAKASHNEARSALTKSKMKVASLDAKCRKLVQPLIALRKDIIHREAAKKVIQDMLDKLTPAEADLDKAEEATSLLSGESVTDDMVREAEQATATATDSITRGHRLIEQKRGAAVPREEMEKINERFKSSWERLAKLKASHKEARERIMAKRVAEITAEVTEQVNSLNANVEKVVPIAEALLKSRGADEDNPLQAMDAAKKDIDAVLETTTKILDDIKGHLDSIKTARAHNDQRSALMRFKGKVTSLDAMSRKLVRSLQELRVQAVSDAIAAVIGELRAHVRSKDITPGSLFDELKKGDDIPLESMRTYIKNIEGNRLKAAQLDLALGRYTAGISKISLLAMLQEYMVSIKEIAMTTVYKVKDSQTLRKLGVNEVVEVLEAGQLNDASGLQRARCRALVDQKEGWVTIKGNQGTSFLAQSTKPYYICEEEVQLQSEFESTSANTGKVPAGEILEILEGPRKEPAVELQRLRGKAPKDGKIGFVTLSDETLELTKLLVCKVSVAFTPNFDIGEGKAIRKLDIGETLDILEEPQQDGGKGLLRIKAKARTDDKEGWVTMKGNQGTAFVEVADNYYVCKAEVPLERQKTVGGSPMRTLEAGEVFVSLEGPKTLTKEGDSRVRGRTLSACSEGWFTVNNANVQRWAARQRCVQSTDLHNKVEMASADVVRKVAPGEVLVALASPVMEKAAGVLRIHVSAEDDGAVGFMSVRGDQSATVLEPILDER